MPANTGSVTDQTFNRWERNTYSYTEYVDRFLRLFGLDGFCGIGYYSSQISGNVSPSFYDVGNTIASARFAPSMIKSGLKAYQFFSGNMFREWGENPNWLDVAMDVCIVVARFLNPLCWLNRLKVINLGKHANAMGMVVSCGFAGATTLYFIHSSMAYANNTDPAQQSAKMAQVFFSVADLLGSPWECGFGFMATPVMALIGAICATVACACYFIAEWFFAMPPSMEAVAKTHQATKEIGEAQWAAFKGQNPSVPANSFAEHATTFSTLTTGA
jgi:hypothetical protein